MLYNITINLLSFNIDEISDEGFGNFIKEYDRKYLHIWFTLISAIKVDMLYQIQYIWIDLNVLDI